MSRCLVPFASLLAALPALSVSAPVSSVSTAGLPIVFEPGNVRDAPEVKFLARAHRFNLLLTNSAAILRHHRGGGSPTGLAIEWLGANPHASLEGVSRTGGTSNYLFSSLSAHCLRSVPHYQRVRYDSLYPGIDLVFYDNNGKLEFDFVLSPGADLSDIRLAARGARAMRIDDAGDLVLGTARGEFRLAKPLLYQPSPQGNRPVEGGFVLEGGNSFSFRTGPYDRQQPLIIDPTLSTSYIGGQDVDIVSSVATDSSGNIYITGYTASTAFPVSTTPLKNSLIAGDADAFVMKLNPTMTTILYSTYLGGSFPDYGRAITVDSTGAAYITGSTIGRFPTTTGAFRELASVTPAPFVAKLDPSGATLSYATYLDGAGAGMAIAVDSSGSAYVAGSTYTATFTTTTGAFQRTYAGGTDGFVVKLNPTGSSQVYSTFLGGSSEDQITGIRVDSSGAAYVAGFTSSTDFPVTAGAYRNANSGSTDAFVAKINSTGAALVYSTFLGGSNLDRAHGIDINSSGEAYVAGQTYSSSFPTTPGAFRTTHGGAADGFVARLNAAGSGLLYSTFLGGAGTCLVNDPFRQYACDGAFSVALDSAGQAWVAGVAGNGFPLSGAIQPSAGGNGDAFVAQLNAAGTSLPFSTYIGGGAGDVALSVAVSGAGGTIVAGFTNSTDLPVNSLQTTRGGGAAEGFLSLLPTCSVTLGSSGSFFPKTAGTYLLDVFAAPGCAWSASTDASWVTLNTNAGVSNGQASYTVAANTGSARTAHIWVAGQTYTIQQVSGQCITLASASSWFPQSGGAYSLQVFASCPWTTSVNVNWITGVTPSGSGDGVIQYTVAANTSTSSRTGQIDVSGTTFAVNQVGGPAGLSCSYSLSRGSDSFAADGGSSSLLVSTQSGCQWTTSTNSSWLTITAGLAGSGEGVIGYSADRNTSGTVRSVAVSVAGQSLVVTQAP
ncbi:MAG: SBBP repeat-containing protein [Bryobacterales bacterium]|nr:SBBP repeat-containing protein [Bryobacterales bacterium]